MRIDVVIPAQAGTQCTEQRETGIHLSDGPEGIDSADRGELIPAEEVFDRVRTKLEAKAAKPRA